MSTSMTSKSIFKILLLSFLLILIPAFFQNSAEAQSNSPPLSTLEVIQHDNAEAVELIGYLNRGSIDQVIWSTDGKQLGIVNPMGVWVHDAENLTANTRLLLNPYGHIFEAVFSPDGRRLAFTTSSIFGAMDIFVRLSDVETSAEIGAFNGIPSTKIYTDVALSNLWMARSSNDRIYIHEVQSGEIRHELILPEVAGFELAFTSDGSYLIAIDSQGELYLWETENFALVSQSSTGYDPYELFISPDSRHVVIVTHSSVAIWDIAQQTEIITIPNRRDINVSFNQTGSLVAISWTEYPRHDNPVSMVAILATTTGSMQLVHVLMNKYVHKCFNVIRLPVGNNGVDSDYPQG